MNKINYQKELDKLIAQIQGNKTPSLLLHACCAPCSSYCLEYLSDYFDITVFYFNPNISYEEEYKYRLNEEKRLISLMNFKNPVKILEGRYNPDEFYKIAKGLENEPEGGKRCEKCFELRLNETAKTAAEKGFDYFTTTLTISPLKNAQILYTYIYYKNAGKNTAQSGFVPIFKKKEGYKRSIVLSHKYDLYRQNYCGCVFSKKRP